MRIIFLSLFLNVFIMTFMPVRLLMNIAITFLWFLEQIRIFSDNFVVLSLNLALIFNTTLFSIKSIKNSSIFTLNFFTFFIHTSPSSSSNQKKNFYHLIEPTKTAPPFSSGPSTCRKSHATTQLH
jgi:hypothetical protein